MKFKLENHVVGKVYDLTQENMNAMIEAIEKLDKQAGPKACAALEIAVQALNLIREDAPGGFSHEYTARHALKKIEECLNEQ